ncbi:MAG: amino acid ABC transporter permease [Promethearchaeota archaeon]
MNEETKLKDEDQSKFMQILKKIRLTRSNAGWWFVGIVLLLLFIGTVISWFDSEAHYFDLILTIANWILLPFGKSLNTLDERYDYSTIFRGLATGAALTFSVSIVSVILGFLLGMLLAVILVNKNRPKEYKHAILRFFQWLVEFLAQAFVDFFRSTPLLVQILLVYFGLPRGVALLLRAINWSFLSAEIFAGGLALTLNTAAYQAEIIRSGILAIPSGQTEAARALGLTQRQTMTNVVVPQAVRIIVPPLTNELVNVILNSSLISAIGVMELTKRSQALQAYYFLWYVFIFAAVYYFVIAFTLAKIAKRLEIKLRIPGLGVHND